MHTSHCSHSKGSYLRNRCVLHTRGRWRGFHLEEPQTVPAHAAITERECTFSRSKIKSSRVSAGGARLWFTTRPLGGAQQHSSTRPSLSICLIEKVNEPIHTLEHQDRHPDLARRRRGNICLFRLLVFFLLLLVRSTFAWMWHVAYICNTTAGSPVSFTRVPKSLPRRGEITSKYIYTKRA